MLLFAPDVTQGPDGRYYLYYVLDQLSVISVAVCDSPAGICGKMKGRVFEVSAETALAENQFLLSERQGEQGPVARLLCGEPPEGGVPAAPGLEDAFLAIYREGAV
jgi:hypothetical protein